MVRSEVKIANFRSFGKGPVRSAWNPLALVAYFAGELS